MNTVSKAWIVCRQFHSGGERFSSQAEADTYAEFLARRIGGEVVEIFQCVANIAADVPLVKISEPSGGDK